MCIKNDDINFFMQPLNVDSGAGVSITENQEQSEQSQSKISTKELDLGIKFLEEGNFAEAKKHFSMSAELDSYDWKPYWGLFKCELKAKDDNDIYFPGFIKQLKQSEMGIAVPLYVEYYKLARKKAYIVRTSEINFDYIELKYQQADIVQKNYDDSYKKTKFSYENKRFEYIPSDEGRNLAKQYAIASENYTNALIEGMSRKYGIRFLIFAIGMFLLGFSVIFGYEILENGTYANYEKSYEYLVTIAGICIILGSIAIVWKLIPIPNSNLLFLIIKGIVFISLIGYVFSWIGKTIMRVGTGSIEDIVFMHDEFTSVALILIGTGLASLLIWGAYIAKIIYWKKRENDLFDECNRLELDTISAMKKDLMALASLPENDYYHIALNTDYSFNASQYVETIFNSDYILNNK